MSNRLDKDSAVNRLLDMVVEEVSLVDRAANNRKFLIVKRDPNMDENTELDKAEGDLPPADDTNDTADEFGDGSPLGAALAALESLTSIVEVLGSLGANRADTRLAELARELRDTAEQILAQVGDGSKTPPARNPDTADLEPGANGDGSDTATVVEGRVKPKGKPPKKPAGRKPPNTEGKPAEDEDSTDEIAAAKSALGKLAKMLEGLMPPAAPPSAGAGDTSEFATNISKLTESVQALTQSLQTYEQRLGRVEKQFGLPNSAPPAEQVSKSADDTVGWPLDLNHPMDRQNVDKAVSFHDP